jgi:hypothetical protein
LATFKDLFGSNKEAKQEVDNALQSAKDEANEPELISSDFEAVQKTEYLLIFTDRSLNQSK